MGSMPSKAISFLLLLVLLSACHGKRKAIETISMSQHQRQEVWYHDTLWQQLNLCLDGITMEWQVDSSKGKQGTLMRIQAEHAELGTQRQSHAELKVENQHIDTVATHRKVVETTPRESAAGAWRVWGIAVILLLVIAVVAYLWWCKR